MLRWAARDISEVGGARKILRNKVKQEEKDHSAKWQAETNATFGYGEITRVSQLFRAIESLWSSLIIWEILYGKIGEK